MTVIKSRPASEKSWYTTQEAADYLGLKRTSVHSAIGHGKLAASTGPRTGSRGRTPSLITAASLEYYAKTRRWGPGRPKESTCDSPAPSPKQPPSSASARPHCASPSETDISRSSASGAGYWSQSAYLNGWSDVISVKLWSKLWSIGPWSLEISLSKGRK